MTEQQIEEEIADFAVVINELGYEIQDLEVTNRSDVAELTGLNFGLHIKVGDLCNGQVDQLTPEF